MSAVDARLLFSCFLKSYLVNAAYNPWGLQNIGFVYAIGPGLARIYGPGERLGQALMRYARHHNCHPFLTPMLLGVLLRLETAIAEDKLEPAVLEGLKDTTANSLSAIGDSFFNGTLLATWALICSCLLLAALPGLTGLFTLVCFAALQLFKLTTCFLGFRKGMAVLPLLRRLDLINWGDRLKCVNAGLLGLFLWQALPGASVVVWSGTLFYLLVTGWVVEKWHAPRVIVALMLLAFAVTMHMSGLFQHIPALLT